MVLDFRVMDALSAAKLVPGGSWEAGKLPGRGWSSESSGKRSGEEAGGSKPRFQRALKMVYDRVPKNWGLASYINTTLTKIVHKSSTKFTSGFRLQAPGCVQTLNLDSFLDEAWTEARLEPKNLAAPCRG